MLRALVMRGRFLLLLLIPIIAYWKINEITALDYLRPVQAREAEPQLSGRQVYASEQHQNTIFTVDNVRYKWTTIHANVLEDKDIRYTEVLAFLEDLTYDGPISIHHQVIVPSGISDIIETVSCNFKDPVTSTNASMRYEMPHAWYAVLLTCQIPDSMQLPTDVIVEVRTRRAAVSVRHNIQLKSYPVEDPSDTSNLAFCLSPMFGELDLFKILEWRLHHARLGISTVHWYSREGNFALKTLVDVLNHSEGLKDTWKEATPLSPDTYQKERLLEHGLYGDQVLYYIDCLERSKHFHPSHWLAFVDLDEFFLPEPFELSGIDDFLDHPTHKDIATICMDRNQAESAPSQNGNSRLLFEDLTQLVQRQQDHPTDNRKCLHRPGSLLVPFVHWPLLLREGQTQKEVVYNHEGDYLRLLHASHKAYWGTKIPLGKTEQYTRHVQQLRRSVNYYLRTYPELFQ